MNNKDRKQPVYDNKEIVNATKYDLNKVNSINKGNGEMSFDSTITYKEKGKKSYKDVIIASIVSGILLIATFLIAFTDLKYLIFPKEKEVVIDTDFEDKNVMHVLECTSNEISNALSMVTKKKFTYNNNKVKGLTYEYSIVILDEERAKDEEFISYMEKTYNIVDVYKGIDGLELTYNHENNTNYYFRQDIDLNKLSRDKNYNKLTDVYLDQSINIIKSRMEKNGLICEEVKK